jgi:osmoprotectant transport system permease protein
LSRGASVVALAALVLTVAHSAQAQVRIGSKTFTESVILGELAMQRMRAAGVAAEHRRALGGSRVLWAALLRGDIDVYPEYTGTLREELLPSARATDLARLQRALLARGLRATATLGFDNTYAIGMQEARAAASRIRTLSDLARHPELPLGFSSEFMDRKDGWPALRDRYHLAPRSVRGLDHDLAYRALVQDEIAATDMYSTDAEIAEYGLRVLDDDRGLFPEYAAVYLYRAALAEPAVRALAGLERRIDARQMIAMNARAKLEAVPEAVVARDALAQLFGTRTEVHVSAMLERVLQRTREHLTLVGISLLCAACVAVPLGVFAARRPRLGQVLLALAGILQTVPSLALLVLMIPLLGIGTRPAMAALFLYSLLPILRNTQAGLDAIPAELRDSAEALGLSSWERLRFVELPMASPSILAGVKTSAVINVGTATLGALIGAGGYGQPILTGIRLDDTALILEGALPAAGLALLMQAAFEVLERRVVPAGLRRVAR